MGKSEKARCIARLAILVPAIILAISCTQSDYEQSFLQNWKYTFNDGDEQFASLDALTAWVHKDIRYGTDASLWGHEEYWASPEQTLRAAAGDCDDDAILFMYFAYTRGLASAPELVAVRMSDTVGHALVRVGDMIYDPTNGVWGPASDITVPILFTMDYGRTMYIATHDHDESRNLVAGMRLDRQ
jgi:predicted transglutaminase-like cysteine proteinase